MSEMIAGVFLGPSLFGLLLPEYQQMLFPKETLKTLYVGAQLGVGLYMFLVGVEFRTDLFHSRARSAASVSLAGMLVPFGLAVLLAPWLLAHPGLFSDKATLYQAILFLGAAISITAFPMLARIIYERGLTGTALGTLALSAGAIDDAAAWCVLAIVLASFGAGAAVAVKAIAGASHMRPGRPHDWIAAVDSTRSAGRGAGPDEQLDARRRLMSCLDAGGSGQRMRSGSMPCSAASCWARPCRAVCSPANCSRSSGAIAVVVSSCPCCVLLHVLRTERPRLGHGQQPQPRACHRRPSGRVDPRERRGACWAAARLNGEDNRTALAVGTLMNARGLMELIIVNIGLQKGVIQPPLFSMLVLIAIITTLMASPVFEWVYGREARMTGQLGTAPLGA